MADFEQFAENFLNACDFQDAVSITTDTALADLPEWDSLAALGVIVMFDMEYSKTIVGEQLRDAETVGDLFKLLD